MLTETTNGISISVLSQFEDTYQKAEDLQYFFSYRITIENKNTYAVRLLKRSWTITDSLGEERIVEGDGVIGETPVIAPGDTFEYSSACNLRSEIGKMKGEYLMRNESTGETFHVSIPEFELMAPFKVN